jgi:8-amino-3,8-dideoxy-alpha-D-manno-octulosonate transaminase
LTSEGIIADKDGLYPIHMTQWGLHIYYNIPALVNKRGNSKISVWDLAENSFARDYKYDKGTCPNLDSLIERTILICIASVLTDSDIEDIIRGIKKSASKL